jgi:hypothetical protein
VLDSPDDSGAASAAPPTASPIHQPSAPPTATAPADVYYVSEPVRREWEDRAWDAHLYHDARLQKLLRQQKVFLLSGGVLVGLGGAIFIAWGLSYPISALSCLGTLGGSCGLYSNGASRLRAYNLAMGLTGGLLIGVGIPLLVLGGVRKSSLGAERTKYFRAHPVVGPGTAGLGFRGRF